MIQLALPVVLSYLGYMLMGVVDIICVGHVGATSIGAVGVGTSIFSWFMVFGMGLLGGLDYLVSYAQGAGKPEKGHRALIQSLIACTVIAVPLTLALVWIALHLDWIGVNEQVRPEASRYLIVLGLSLWSTFAFSAIRQYLTARGAPLPPMIILLLANVMNLAANWLLVFGNGGFPRLGAYGSAWATLLSRSSMLLAIYFYFQHWDRRHEGFLAYIPFRVEKALMKEFLRLGLPSALQMMFEVGVFALSTTLAARLTANALAAHQIVLNIASLTFMVPLGISSATAVLVGQARGRGNLQEAAKTGWHGLSLGIGYMAVSGLVLYFFSQPILSCFTSDASVRTLATQIIFVAALFQLSDGAQVVGTGALRGLGDTRSSMFGNLCGHWMIGLPIGLFLCFKLGWGLIGIWTGLSLGLTSVAAFLLTVWRLKTRTP